MIESVSTDGSDRKLIFQDNSAHFFDLYLTDQYLYYSDWHRPLVVVAVVVVVVVVVVVMVVIVTSLTSTSLTSTFTTATGTDR
jgi:hypothetical protein